MTPQCAEPKHPGSQMVENTNLKFSADDFEDGVEKRAGGRMERAKGFEPVVEDHNFGGIHELAPNLEEFMLRGIWG